MRGPQDVVDRHEDALGDGEQGAFRAAFAGQAAQLGAEVKGAGTGGGAGNLAEAVLQPRTTVAPQPGVAGPRLAAYIVRPMVALERRSSNGSA